MKTSIATVSISGNFREKLEAIAGAGFDGIEIFEQDFLTDTGTPREVGNLIRDHGLEITLFQPFRDFECLPSGLREKAFDRARRKFDLMSELGTDTVLFCSSCHPKSLGGIERAADDFRELGDIAKSYGIKVGYEALAWGRHINDHRDAWEIVRRADHPNIGIILDSFHTLSRKLSPDSIRSIPGDKIFFVQLADAPLIDMDLLYWSRHFRNMPGEGDLDVTGFMRAVASTGYKGPISLEIFNDQFRGANPSAVSRDGYRSLIALMDDVRRAEPDIEVDLPDFAPRIKPEGVSFVEFTARGPERENLSRYFETLGFSKVGRHRNKDVDLYRQGDIRLVLNGETTGHAASAWHVRGTSICDIGLRVPSARDTVARAEALGAKPFGQPLGEGELEIPAIRGLEGSVMHFVDTQDGTENVWDVEFQEVAGKTSGAGLVRVDHVAQTMSYEDMLSWTLFYTSIFDMHKAPMVDVIDPDGLVRSQVVASPDGALRVTLNGAETHRTLAGRFLAESFGASVQHIALETKNIFETAKKLAALGFESLDVPPNYYDDVAVRYDIAPEMLSAIRSQNIFYDADEQGEFLQVYSRNLVGGVFFEILERRGNYQGYGAPNAPFRIAAQKRAARGNAIPQS